MILALLLLLLSAAPPGVSVLVFLSSDCPISNRYAPEIRRLHEAFAPRGVRFRLVYPADSAEVARSHAREYALPGEPENDAGHRLVRRNGARVTPEAAVLARGGKLLYRGRIDDRYAGFGKMSAAPATRDLEAAIEAALAGKASKFTRAVGCAIPDAR